MKKLIRWFDQQKLNIKFTVIIGAIVFVPILVMYLMIFQNRDKEEISQVMSAAEYRINESYSQIKKTADLCNMSTQFFLNNQNLYNFLIRLKDNDTISSKELVEFYKNDIKMLERLVNSNPYLYQVRVYADNNNFSEMLPILYKKERMMNLPWSKSYANGEWEYNYKDEIFTDAIMNPAQHMMALISSVTEYERGEIGVIEVAVQMDSIFPDVFEVDNTKWGCFIDKKENIHTAKQPDDICKWESKKEKIISLINTSSNSPIYQYTIIDDEPVVLCYMPIKELSGGMIQLISLSENMSKIASEKNMYLTILVIAYILLIILINYIVKRILTKFYKILKAIRKVQKGDLDVVIDNCGTDEMGEMAVQINTMLYRIKKLLDENIKREVLIKDSEIRALQNQINAHFIYNVLESIKMMAEIDEKYEISDAVTALGKLLRYSMKWVSHNVTVEQEIDYIKSYLELINLRLDYEITLSLNIPSIAYKQEIPKMSLQPIIENAIIHGIDEIEQNTSIYVKAIINESRLSIEITDSGSGMTEEELDRLQKKILGEIEAGGGAGNGIGLKNVQDRIQITFGKEYGIRIVSKKECYTKVIVEIPITYSEK